MGDPVNPRRVTPGGVCTALGILILLAGCAAGIGVEPVSLDKRFEQLDRSALTDTLPSERTLLVLRQEELLKKWKHAPDAALSALSEKVLAHPDRKLAFAVSELCFLQAEKLSRDSRERLALLLSAAFYSYNYLFDPGLGEPPSPYQPQTTWALELYNRSLAQAVKLIRSRGIRLKEGWELPMIAGVLTVLSKRTELSWKPEEFDELHLAYEFKVTGLDEHHGEHGIGAPLIAVRLQDRPGSNQPRASRDVFRSPVVQTYPATIVVSFTPWLSGIRDSGGRFLADITMHDPMRTKDIAIGDARIPLEADLSTPLAYMIQEGPRLRGVQGLLKVNTWHKVQGLYTLQPYQPDRIPIVFVHGLMSKPATWLPMFNSILGDPVLRGSYQFWFYLYPTGNPLLYSASQLRATLLKVRAMHDPEGRSPYFNNMVVVGHSMGGLIAKLMVQNGGEPLWRTISETPFSNVRWDADDRRIIEQAFFFEPLPFISREIFLATPHRGSTWADHRIGLFGATLVDLPAKLIESTTSLFSALVTMPFSRRFAEEGSLQLRRIPTGIDGLSPSNPVLGYLANAPLREGVPYHSIIGDKEAAGLKGGTDGIVPYASAHLDGAASEIVVHCGHSVQASPQAIREVMRILHEHLLATGLEQP
ncbi:esterase/lipase family protein [Desulfocurvibacter africanus]|uniref:esterase/lipase family protein n=1 Tax=Desulfocurvibacter africanus TaxID=873 RepID=UPI0004831D13|nr:alpha/beta fold hydrolase [Desulfocurvibacter africanus]